MAERAYLDWNASAPLRAEAQAAVLDTLAQIGNPSSVHAEGRAVRHLVERARAQLASLVEVEPGNVTLTSGATEANVLALSPGWSLWPGAPPFERLLVSAVEHVSVLEGGRFSPERVRRIPVDMQGVLDRSALAAMLAGPPALVSVMLANNETGVIQPVHEVADLVHEAGGLLHVDAVQAPGRMVCHFNDLGADLVTFSAHKIGGPKGAGALIRKSGLHLSEPLIRGGGQERGLRGGTENVPGIVGFGAAAAAIAARLADDVAHMAGLRLRLEAGLRTVTPDVIIFGEPATRLPNTTLFTHPGLRAETAVIAFDLEGVAVSSGAACSSGKVQPSHVLAAMGISPRLAQGAIRVSSGHSTTERDVELFLNAWKKLSETLLKGRTIIAA